MDGWTDGWMKSNQEFPNQKGPVEVTVSISLLRGWSRSLSPVPPNRLQRSGPSSGGVLQWVLSSPPAFRPSCFSCSPAGEPILPLVSMSTTCIPKAHLSETHQPHTWYIKGPGSGSPDQNPAGQRARSVTLSISWASRVETKSGSSLWPAAPVT